MYKKIIVPLDGSDLAECVLPHMEAIAKGCGMPEVILIHVIQSPETSWSYTYLNPKDLQKFMAEDNAKAEKASTDYLDQIVKKDAYKGLNIKYEVFIGDTAETIANYANNNEADLVIIATHGRSGVSRWTYGSVADKILRSVCMPVLMVRAPGCVLGM